MPHQLQVRQLLITSTDLGVTISVGNWYDVPSPSWLQGYVIPNVSESGVGRFAYEFRHAPADVGPPEGYGI